MYPTLDAPTGHLKGNPDIRLLDVRSPQEREQACIENSVLLDQELVEEMLGYYYGDEVIHRDNMVMLND